MTALSLSNLVTRGKYYFPSTTMDTELQSAILERMNYLVSLGVFPFQEKYQYLDLAAGNYRLSTPLNYATVKNLIIFTGDYERPLDYLDSATFDRMFPKPDEEDAGEPVYYTIKVAESEIWLNCPTDNTYSFRMLFYAIPDDASDTTISQLTELAKLCVMKWGVSDCFRMISEHDRATQLENEGNEMLSAIKKRYAYALEADARMISSKEYHQKYRGH